VPAQQSPRQDYMSKGGNTIAVTKKESTGRGVLQRESVTAVTGAPERSTGQRLRARGCPFICYRIRIWDVLGRCFYCRPRGAWAAAIAICGARPANRVGTSCKPLTVLRCGRRTGQIGKCRNMITVTKRESTGRGVTRGVTAVTRGVRAVSVVTASVTPCNTHG
jgi:hypothetical protein